MIKGSRTAWPSAGRGRLERRDAAGRALGWLLPSVGVQALLTRLAHTDLVAQRAYQHRSRAFHARLRSFYSAIFSTIDRSTSRTSTVRRRSKRVAPLSNASGDGWLGRGNAPQPVQLPSSSASAVAPYTLRRASLTAAADTEIARLVEGS